MIISKNIFVTLLVEKFFKNFIPNKGICNTNKNSEVLLSLSVQSKTEVDDFIRKAVDAGAEEYREVQDYG